MSAVAGARVTTVAADILVAAGLALRSDRRTPWESSHGCGEPWNLVASASSYQGAVEGVSMQMRTIAAGAAVVALLGGCATESGSDGTAAAGAPISVADEDWVDRDGQETDLVTSFRGDAHCDLETTEIVRVSTELVPSQEPGSPEATFAHDPEGGLPDRLTAAEYDGEAELPDDAEAAGVRTASGVELWVVPNDAEVIYLVDGGTVEQWPAAVVDCD